MTGRQKGQLKDYILELEKIGSVSSNKAITAIDECLGAEGLVLKEDAAGLIRRVEATIKRERNNA